MADPVQDAVETDVRGGQVGVHQDVPRGADARCMPRSVAGMPMLNNIALSSALQ